MRNAEKEKDKTGTGGRKMSAGGGGKRKPSVTGIARKQSTESHYHSPSLGDPIPEIAGTRKQSVVNLGRRQSAVELLRKLSTMEGLNGVLSSVQEVDPMTIIENAEGQAPIPTVSALGPQEPKLKNLLITVSSSSFTAPV